MEDFKIEPLFETLKKVDVTELQWRRNLIEKITGGKVYDFKEGFIIVEVPALEFYREIYSNNVSKRLDTIIHELVHGGEYIERWITELFEINDGTFTLDEIATAFNFSVTKKQLDLKTVIKDILKQLNSKERGCYEIKFPNGKIYYNISKDIKAQVRKHLNGLFYAPTLKWHSIAIKENSGLKPLDLKIIYYPLREEKWRKHWKEKYDSEAANHMEDFYC